MQINRVKQSLFQADQTCGSSCFERDNVAVVILLGIGIASVQYAAIAHIVGQ